MIRSLIAFQSGGKGVYKRLKTILSLQTTLNPREEHCVSDYKVEERF